MSPETSDAYVNLPGGWQLERLKFFADVRSSNVDKVISEDETPVRLCNYTDVYYNDRITSDMDFMEGSASDVELARFHLKAGQVLLTKDSESWQDIGVPALVAEDMLDTVCGYHLSVLDPRLGLDGGYLAWLCRSAPLNDQFKLGANGVTRFGLGQYPLKNAWVTIPPIEVQQRIARFLDEKTARVDALIEKKQALLERLAEKRQALITRAVTKGLNSDVPIKPSGVDWLGDIPAHWTMAPLRWYLRTASGDAIRNEDIEAVRSEEDATPVIGGNGLMGFTSEANSCDTSLVVGRVGALCGNVHLVSEASWITDNALKVYDISGYVVSYLLHALRVRDLNSLANRNAQPLMTGEIVRAQLIPIPPTCEQQEIGRFIDDELERMSAQRLLVEKSIGALHEYRSASITAAVTGQLPELNG